MLRSCRLDDLGLRRRARVAVLDRRAIRRGVQGDAQVIALLAEHEVDGVDRGSEQRLVRVPGGGIVLLEDVLPVSAVVLIGVVARPADERVVALSALQRVVAGAPVSVLTALLPVRTF